MGINLSQYRASIGLFNRCKFTCACYNVGIYMFNIICLSIILQLLLICGDIEINPGPTQLKKLKSLNVCHDNIRSLNAGKIRAIATSLCNVYDIITLSETFLRDDSNINLNLQGYHAILLHRDRPTAGGGLAIYIKENIPFKRVYDIESKHIEIMWIEINTIHDKILVCNVYRPPNHNDFWEHFSTNIEHVKDTHKAKYMLLLGDLNADPTNMPY